MTGKRDATGGKLSRDGRESALALRGQVADFSLGLEADGREGLALLEEHVDALGGKCPSEILDSRDAILESARSARAALEDVQDDLYKIYRCGELRG